MRARFDPDRLRAVLDRYDLGPIGSIREAALGSPAASKAIIESARGRLLLKRRTPSRSAAETVALGHAAQEAAALGGVGVAMPLQTRDGLRAVPSEEGTHELFPWIDGDADRGGPAEAFASGKTLAAFAHASGAAAAGSATGSEVQHRLYHDSPAVRTWLAGLSTPLVEAYERLSANARDRLAGSLGARVLLHGDWHPGNLLYDYGPPLRIAAVIDFDGAAVGPVWLDVACGALMTGLPRGLDALITGGPLRLDADRVLAFLRGFRAGSSSGGVWAGPGWEAVPALMVLTLLAELAEPVAVTGSLGALDGRAALAGLERELPRLEAQCERLVMRATGTADRGKMP